MADWLVVKNNSDPFTVKESWKNIIHFGSYGFYVQGNVENKYYQKSENCFIFLDGFILNRLSLGKSSGLIGILDDYLHNEVEFINHYKGDFVLIIIHNDKLLLYSDYFGVARYFYHSFDNRFIASNRVSVFAKFLKLSLNQRNLYLYFLLNYLPYETTFFNEVKKNIGGQYLEVENGEVKEHKYFNILDFLSNRTPLKLKDKDIFHLASEKWMQLIEQYLNFTGKDNIAITLTAGLDSRLILAALQKLNVKPLTFTFGRKDSMDVHYAKIIAEKLKLEHHHFYPSENFFSNFRKQAIKTVDDGDGIVTLFRAHRYNAYQQLKEFNVDSVFFGYIGSEVIRGIHPDGLIFPFFFIDQWLGKKIDFSEYLQKTLGQLDVKFIKETETYINDRFSNWEPDQHIFDFLIPLHFRQDISLVKKLEMTPFVPYWDMDYLEFQKTTPFFINVKDKQRHASLGHFKRIMGPKYSAEMLCRLDPVNARMTLGKGYSPADFVVSPYLAGIRYVIRKKFSSIMKVPNFSYDEWFRTYLKEEMVGLKNRNDFLKFDDSSFDLQKGSSELYFLNIVKRLNIIYHLNSLNKTNI